MPGERFSKGSVTFVLYRFQNYWNFDLEYQRDKKKKKNSFPGPRRYREFREKGARLVLGPSGRPLSFASIFLCASSGGFNLLSPKIHIQNLQTN